MGKKIKLMHLITGLDTGGAEAMLYKLLSRYDRDQFLMCVVSLTDIGPVGEKIQSLGVHVHSLKMRKNILFFLSMVRFVRLLKKEKPHILQTWMYHADLVGALMKLFVRKMKLVWNVRHGSLEENKGLTKKLTVYVAKLCAYLSRSFPDKIICCSVYAAKFYIKFGYCASKILVIPNGVDLVTFKPDSIGCLSLREELNLSKGDLIIGTITRFHPDKNFVGFIQAASIVAASTKNTCFVCCGRDIDQQNTEILSWIASVGLRDRFYLLGERHDIPRVLSAFDVFVSSSVTEGFPNVIVEAMACGVPCIVTDVGDSAYIVDNTVCVMPPGDPKALAAGIARILSMPPKAKREIIAAGISRVTGNFSLDSIVNRYQALYRSVMR